MATDIWKHISRGGLRLELFALIGPQVWLVISWANMTPVSPLLDLLPDTGANVEWNKLR